MVEPLIKQSWTARILAMFYEVVDGDDYLGGALKDAIRTGTWPIHTARASAHVL